MPARSKAASKPARGQEVSQVTESPPDETESTLAPIQIEEDVPQLSVFADKDAIALPVLPIALNQVNLVGHCGSDPEIRYFESGTVKATISLAVRRRTKDSPPDWFHLEMWANTAETLYNYVRKGDQIGVSGYLKIETWLDRELGISRSKPVIKVERLYLLGSKRNSENINQEEE
jgi:single-strand DNA-binding protein